MTMLIITIGPNRWVLSTHFLLALKRSLAEQLLVLWVWWRCFTLLDSEFTSRRCISWMFILIAWKGFLFYELTLAFTWLSGRIQWYDVELVEKVVLVFLTEQIWPYLENQELKLLLQVLDLSLLVDSYASVSLNLELILFFTVAERCLLVEKELNSEPKVGRVDFKVQLIVILKFIANYDLVGELAVFITAKSDRVRLNVIQLLKHVRVVCFHLVTNEHLKILDLITGLDFNQN